MFALRICTATRESNIGNKLFLSVELALDAIIVWGMGMKVG